MEVSLAPMPGARSGAECRRKLSADVERAPAWSAARSHRSRGNREAWILAKRCARSLSPGRDRRAARPIPDGGDRARFGTEEFLRLSRKPAEPHTHAERAHVVGRALRAPGSPSVRTCRTRCRHRARDLVAQAQSRIDVGQPRAHRATRLRLRVQVHLRSAAARSADLSAGRRNEPSRRPARWPASLTGNVALV